MPISKRKIYFIISTFLLLVLVIFLIIKPAASEIKSITVSVRTQKEKLEKLYVAGQLLKTTQEQYQKIESQISEVSKIFITQGQELEFITRLEEIALKNNLIQKIDLQEPIIEENQTKDQKDRQYETLPLRLNISGNYPNLLKYLTNLESLDYYINIENFRILAYHDQDINLLINKEQSTPNANYITALINANVFRNNQK